jgi:hypothetical protein
MTNESDKELRSLAPAAGFELKPADGFRVTMRWEKAGAVHELTHLFARPLNRGERLNIAAEASKQILKGDIIRPAGDLEAKYVNAWEHMIAAVEGYTFNDKPAELDEIRDRIPPGHKRSAVEATNQVDLLKEQADSAGFSLDDDDLIVRLEASQGGDPITLAHTFGRTIPDADMRTLKSAASQFRSAGRDGVLMDGGNTISILEKIYDRLIVRADGYNIEGKPLTTSSPDWKDQVPVDHKVLAVNALRSRRDGLNKD